MNSLVNSYTDLLPQPTTLSSFASTDAYHPVTHFTSFLASQLVSSLSANLSTQGYLDEPLNLTYLTSESDLTSPSGSPELPSTSSITLANPSYIEFRDRSRFWIQRILVPLVMIIGVIGNSMTIVIMTRRRMRSSTNFYLAALASIDMMYLIFIFILSLKHYPDADHSTFYYYWVFYPFSLMIVDGCSNISVWLTVTFTFERFIVVTHPIRGKVICTEARAKKVILAVFIICFTYVLPTPFEWIIVEKLSPLDNSTRIDVRYSDFGRNKTYRTIYYWTTSVLFTFLPLTLLAFFNAFLIRSVQLSRRARSEMTQSKITTAYSTVSKSDPDPSPRLGRNGVVASGTSSGSNKVDHSTAQETKITIMLISVVVLFLCCQSPTAIMLIYSSLRDDGRNTNEYYLHIAWNNIFNFLVAVNAAGNFVLYSLLSQKYRRTFVQLFCPCIKGRLSRLQSYQQTLYPSNATTIGYSTSSDKRFNELLSVSSDSKSRGGSTSPRVSRVGLPGNGFDFGGRPNSNYNLNQTPTTPTTNMNLFNSKTCNNNNNQTDHNSGGNSDQQNDSTNVVEINCSTNEDKGLPD
ncbi:thyrotropin-releasing hormone receptor-like [Tetranychus urticae]|uniref:G-protein coupled receptors family 1 profile domain-containing protein n=1 Tax=Tetranychus urticae TaxID=32264 RepID=T1K6W4_TETUR|nr:thyrotropin-releasing hormone receptor-like [Tetranychus urticae]